MRPLVLGAEQPAGPLRLHHRYAGRYAGDSLSWSTHNPARIEEIVTQSPLADAAELRAAASTLRARAKTWAATPVIERGECLLTAAHLLHANLASIARLITREMGKTLAEARGELTVAARVLRFYGGLARAAVGDHLPDARPGVRVVTQREPIGAVVVITPWNDPVLTPVRKLAPALLCGNGVLFKPAETTPGVAAALVDLLTEAGVPESALDLVFATGAETGAFLASCDDIDGVSFTGSTRAGRAVTAAVAGRGIRVQAELGGKNAVVVHADADLDRAVPLIMTAAFGQTGQRCSATSRLLVHTAVHDALVARLQDRVTRLRVGDGLRPDTDIGPLANQSQLERVVAALSRLPNGQRLVGGHRLNDGERAGGLFVAPTIASGVDPGAPLWREEIFGPVLALRSYENLDEAIAEVNDSPYGLAASIFTDSLRAAHRFVDEVRVGNATVNLGTMGWDVHIPFGGVRASGFGHKEQGAAAVEFYSSVKTVAWGF